MGAPAAPAPTATNATAAISASAVVHSSLTITNFRELDLTRWQLVYRYQDAARLRLAAAEGAIPVSYGSAAGAPVRVVDDWTVDVPAGGGSWSFLASTTLALPPGAAVPPEAQPLGIQAVSFNGLSCGLASPANATLEYGPCSAALAAGYRAGGGLSGLSGGACAEAFCCGAVLFAPSAPPPVQPPASLSPGQHTVAEAAGPPADDSALSSSGSSRTAAATGGGGGAGSGSTAALAVPIACGAAAGAAACVAAIWAVRRQHKRRRALDAEAVAAAAEGGRAGGAGPASPQPKAGGSALAPTGLAGSLLRPGATITLAPMLAAGWSGSGDKAISPGPAAADCAAGPLMSELTLGEQLGSGERLPGPACRRALALCTLRTSALRLGASAAHVTPPCAT